MSIRVHLRISAVLLAVGVALPAWAQNALGDGRGLERTLNKYPNQGPRGGRDFAAEVRFRNAVVTGNAPGGLSFRGNVPYRDSGEFTASLGSDDLYRFRRDSYYSGLSGAGIRGTEALQYQFAMTTGSSRPEGLVGSLDYRRTIGGRESLTRQDLPENQRDTRGEWLRSTSSFTSTRPLQPTSIGTRRTKEGDREELTTSPLLGVRAKRLPVEMDAAVSGSSARPAPRAAPGIRPTLPVPTNPTAAPGAEPAQPAEPARPGDPTQLDTGSAYDSLLSRIGQWDLRAGATPPKENESNRWQTRVDALRRHLRGDTESPDAATPDADARQLNKDTLTMLREAAGRVNTFVDGPASLDRFAQAMVQGQQALALGKYFEAEERFSRAAMIRPGEPSALVGRMHAQLGAGMYLSAAVNLRQLLTQSPELAGVRYEAATLPATERLTALRTVLMDRLEDRPDADPVAKSMTPREVGLLVAYLGYQTGDEAAAQRGLAAVEADAQAAEPADEEAARLAAVLRAVWLGQFPPSAEKPSEEPAPNPPAATPEK